MQLSFRTTLVSAAAMLAIAGFASHSNADGHIVASTVVSAPHGVFNGVPYRRYEAMFEGVSSSERPYRVPCQIIDAAVFGLADPETANPADQVPFFRGLFVAGNRWCDGICPPPSIWLGAQNQANIHRDANGNALVRFVGGRRMNTTAYRLPEVAVGQNQYIAIDPSYDDGSLAGFLRMSAGGHVDLTGNFTNHARYVRDVRSHARELQAQGYLLAPDADAIIQRAIQSDIGR